MVTVQLLSATMNLQACLNTHTHTHTLPSKTNSHKVGNFLNLLLEKVNLDGSLDGHEYQNNVTGFTTCARSTADVSPNCCIRRLYQNRTEMSQNSIQESISSSQPNGSHYQNL